MVVGKSLQNQKLCKFGVRIILKLHRLPQGSLHRPQEIKLMTDKCSVIYSIDKDLHNYKIFRESNKSSLSLGRTSAGIGWFFWGVAWHYLKTIETNAIKYDRIFISVRENNNPDSPYRLKLAETIFISPLDAEEEKW